MNLDVFLRFLKFQVWLNSDEFELRYFHFDLSVFDISIFGFLVFMLLVFNF